MKNLAFIGLLLFLLFNSGCQDRGQLVVYCDPFLEDSVLKTIEDFESETGVAVELKILSSEFICQSIKHGQPIDIAFLAYARIPVDFGIEEQVGDHLVLGSDRIVKVEVIDRHAGELLGGENCWAIPHSDSPVRLEAEKFISDSSWLNPLACKVYPESYAQFRHYLEKGWVKGGLTFGKMVSGLDGIRIMGESSPIKGLYKAYFPKNGVNTEKSAEFRLFFKDFEL